MKRICLNSVTVSLIATWIGALLVYNCVYVVKKRFGAGEIARLFLLPPPGEHCVCGLSAKPRADCD